MVTPPGKKQTALVEGHLERISSRAFDAYPDQITRLVGRRHGVYALYKGNRLYYVGLATDLRNRIQHHLKDRHARRWDRFSLYLVGRADHLKELETLMVRIASPSGNLQAGQLPGSRNMVRELERFVKEQERRQREGILHGALSSPRGRERTEKFPLGGWPKADAGSLRRRIPLKGILKPNQRLRAVYKGRIYAAPGFAPVGEST